MIRAKKIALEASFAAALVLFATNNSNAAMSGNDLFDMCNGSGSKTLTGLCAGYLATPNESCAM
jgi:hypothetical protein